MKYVLIIGDGMADGPVKDLDGRTPLQVAKHPNMDLITSGGFCGMLTSQPSSFEGTDVAILAILGYDPQRLHVGRGALEAASIGVNLGKADLAFRCNLITVKNGVLEDYSAGHISNEEAKDLIEYVNDRYSKPGEIEFYTGVGFRHLLVLRGSKYSDKIICQPPHYFLNKPISEILVREADQRGEATARLLNAMILSSEGILSSHPVNKARVKAGRNPANMIWPWGPGRRLDIQPFHMIQGLKGAVISAVDVVNGIGVYASMDVIKVPGVTGYYDTNYEGKADYALASLKDHDLVLVHVEAPDEASHIGDYKLKTKTIEDLDSRLIGRILKNIKGDYTVAVLPDHATSTELRVHTPQPIPFAVFSTLQSRKREADRFDEVSVQHVSPEVMDGWKFMPLFINQGRHSAET